MDSQKPFLTYTSAVWRSRSSGSPYIKVRATLRLPDGSTHDFATKEPEWGNHTMARQLIAPWLKEYGVDIYAYGTYEYRYSEIDFRTERELKRW